jgi:CRISPR/Cas system-associated protein Cas10 (large subunit of type III CRISPR-Cas system)
MKRKKTSRAIMAERKLCFGLCNRRKSTKVTDVEADEGGDPNSKEFYSYSTIVTMMNDNERKSKSRYKKLNDTYDQ